VQVRRRQIWHKPRPAAGLGKRTGGVVLEGAMSVGGLGWRPAAHRRGRAKRAGHEEADLGWRAGETRCVAPGRALDGRETRGYGRRRAGGYGRRWAGGRSRRQRT